MIHFTQDNTEGYSQQELDMLNSEMAERVAGLDGDDLERAEKSFADEVARR